MGNFNSVLEHAIKNKLNVLLKGKHGVGKTALVRERFDEHFGDKWKYFSASTMDPWVDFIGVPKEVNGVLELIRPQAFQDDEVEALFFDELNRAHKKVRNAVMELIQFGSINGKKFNNLKVIWAAINPDDDEEMAYDVERLDPAQLDRFELHIDIPYKPDLAYFKRVHGQAGELAVKWWNDQNQEAKETVSPRRLEYAVNVLNTGGDCRYVLTSPKVNVTQFIEYVKRGDPIKALKDLLTKTETEQRAFLSDHNDLRHVKKELINSEEFLKAFAHLLPEEEISSELRPKKRRNKLASFVAGNPEKFENLVETILSNEAAYRKEVVTSFQRYKRNNARATGAAVTKSASATKGTRTVNVKGAATLTSRMDICFTGSLIGFARADATELVESFGCRTSSTITGSVTHLVTGEKCGNSKLVAARRNNVTVITEAEFVSAFAKPVSLSENTVDIGGAEFDVTTLNHDNFHDVTGRRFRMTNDQLERARAGTLSREQAFAEYIRELQN